MVDNGEKVLDYVENDNFDLIILDMQMPVMDGVKAAKLFRVMYPDKKHIPIIMLTANATKEAVDACREAKFNAYLTKPIEPEKLLSTISSLISQSIKTEIEKAKLNIVEIKNLESIPILDFDIIEQISSMTKDKGFIEKLVMGYLEDTSAIISKIETVLSSNDASQVDDLAHAVDGSSRSIGAKRLAKSSNLISQHIKSNSYKKASNEFDNLKLIYKQTKTEFLSYLKEYSDKNHNSRI